MKIINTAILLVITLLAVPLFTFFFGTAPGPGEWKTIYTLIMIMGAVIAYCFIAGEITGNCSQVDKLWSILPVVYIWVVAAGGDFSPRLVLMGVLATLWGVRLTINFGMKGGYSWRFWSGEEDYRWKVLRAKPSFSPRWKWTLFNLFFICGYQNILILLFTLPSVVVLQYSTVPLGLFDWITAVLILLFIAVETVADLEQWNFQNRKKAAVFDGKELTGDLKKGFVNKGLWAYSRHPNYLAEQAVWVCFYLFSIAARAPVINWSITGCLLLVVLFQGSSAFGEEISAAKYPEYAGYQQNVPRFIPFLKRKK
jgi:steroid 5-alpha reductase family enzyme